MKETFETLENNNFVNSEAFKQFDETIKTISSATLQITEGLKPFSDALKSYKATLPDFSQFIKPIQEIALQISKSISKQLENPDSALSYYQYFKLLSDCFWVMPYMITSQEMQKLIVAKYTEEELDKFMITYFSDTLLESLIFDIKTNLSERQNILFTQCINAFKNADYAICGLGLYSLIEDITSFYVFDKGCVTRKGLFKPIVNEMMEKDGLDDLGTMDFILLMIDKNIDVLYEPMSFEKDIQINRHKDTNRNTSLHGKYFSNKKESDLMLLNTMYWLLGLKKYLGGYEGKLVYKKANKCFAIK